MPSEPALTASLDRERAQLERAGSLRRVHWVVVFGSLLLTLGAWYIADNQVQEKNALSFNREAERVVALVVERLRKYEDALWGGVATLQTHGGNMTHTQWRRFAHSLALEEKYPGINGIGVIFQVLPEQRDAYLAEQRRTRPDFGIHPRHGESVFLPITYIEPEAENLAAVGLDMAHEANRYRSAILARDGGDAQITGPIILVQDSGQTPGFLFYAPFYEPSYAPEGDNIAPRTMAERWRRFRGIVYAPFIMHKLMEGTLAQSKRQIAISISDDGDNLYNEHSRESLNHDSDALFTRDIRLELYGRIWEFDLRSTLPFREATHSNQPMYILVGGLLVNALLLLLFVLLSRANHRAIAFAGRMSQNYQNKANDLLLSVKQLENSNRELEQFAYAASHDLQEPLRTIRSFADLLDDEYQNELKGLGTDYLKHLRKSANRMSELIHALLEYSRLGAQRKMEAVDCEQLLQDVQQDLEGSIAATGASIKIGPLPKDLIACQTELRQLFQNLMSNAIKFAKEDVPLQISVTAERQGKAWMFRVRDNGIGMQTAHTSKIFVIFRQLNNRSRYAGNGVGLAICRKIVQLHGGDIHVDSAPNHGSCFRFTIPDKSA